MECCFIIFSIAKFVCRWRQKNGMSRLTGRACLLKLSGTCLGEKILSDFFFFFVALKECLLVLVNLKFLFSIEVKLLQVNTE